MNNEYEEYEVYTEFEEKPYARYRKKVCSTNKDITIMEQEKVKKKRFRVTVGMYKEMNAKIHQYHEMLGGYYEKNKLLETSNGYLEKRSSELKEEIKRLHSVIEEKNAEIVRLKDRGLWARITNKIV